jgi:hypothetical protein
MIFDYSLKTPEERVEYCKEILKNSNPTTKELGYMSDYILFTFDKNQTKKEKRKERPIITKNRQVTIDKRQTSLETLIENLEMGESTLHNLIRNDKNQKLVTKDQITEEEIEVSPRLKENIKVIESLSKQFQTATGPKRYFLKKQIIETWQQIYILRAAMNPAPSTIKASNQIKTFAKMTIDEHTWLGSNGLPKSTGVINLYTPEHVSFLLCYYNQLKQECGDDLQSDMHFLLMDLERVTHNALAEHYPACYDLLIWKIDGLSNEQIIKKMEAKYGVRHTAQYYSSYWRKKVPKIIVKQAQKEWLEWYFTNKEYGSWRECGKCHKIKLEHPLFYSRNVHGRDGWYSICKDCRRVGEETILAQRGGE